MKRLLLIMLVLLLITSLLACKKNEADNKNNNIINDDNLTTNLDDNTEEKDDNEIITNDNQNDLVNNKKLALKINDLVVDVFWANNDSVEELKRIVETPLVINMELYGDFERFGSIGTNITSDDEIFTASYGDILLYESNVIIIMCGTNARNFTKLGHINLGKSEIKELLLDCDSVSITLYLVDDD